MYLWHLMEMWPKFRVNTALQSISPSLRDIRLNSVKAWQRMAEWKWKLYYFVISVSVPTWALWDICTRLLPPGLKSTFCHPFTPNGIRKEEGDEAGYPPVGPSSLYVWPLTPHWICLLSISKRGIIILQTLSHLMRNSPYEWWGTGQGR